MKLFFDDEEFEAQFARTVGKAAVGMADIGESFATASRITAGDLRLAGTPTSTGLRGFVRNVLNALSGRMPAVAPAAIPAGVGVSQGELLLRPRGPGRILLEFGMGGD